MYSTLPCFYLFTKVIYINHTIPTNSMNLFLELRRHGKLAEKRNPMYDKSRFAKFWMYFMAIFWIGYLIFFGTLFAFAFDGGAVEPYHILNAGFIFVMALDFIMRFPFQKTPTQEVKPYLLLPIKRNRLIDFLLIRSGLSGFNLIWLFLFAPFALFTITKFYGFMGVFSYCIGIWLLMLFNNYWFLLCRTLINERIWWVLLPLAIYGTIGAALFVPKESPLFDWSVNLGEGFIHGNPFTFTGLLIAITLLWLINRNIMQKLIYKELSKVEDTTVQIKNVSEYSFLDRYGEVGEYMRLELKMLLRNKITKSSLITITCVVIAFSAILSFTDIYDGTGMKNFIQIYNYVIFGILFLSPLMAYEGNYIDGLMSRKESIYNLLRAKYIIYATAIVIPLLLMIPVIIMGKFTALSCIAWAIFTAGCIYFGLFQLAVYNNSTTNLNMKMTNRNNIGTGIQNVISIFALGVPLILGSILPILIGETMGNWILILIGLSFIATSKLWLKNIYKRFMKRRYKNMEGFRNSRQQ